VLDEDGEHPLPGLPVLSVALLKERVCGGGLEHREFDDVGIVRADAADDLAIAAYLLGHTVAVGLDGDKRVIGITGDKVGPQSNRDFLTVVSFDLTHFLLHPSLTARRSGCP